MLCYNFYCINLLPPLEIYNYLWCKDCFLLSKQSCTHVLPMLHSGLTHILVNKLMLINSKITTLSVKISNLQLKRWIKVILPCFFLRFDWLLPLTSRVSFIISTILIYKQEIPKIYSLYEMWYVWHIYQ